MKKKLCIWGLITLLIFACSLLVFAEPQTDIGILWTSENGETVEIFPTENIFYLPSAMDITKIRFSHEGDISYSGGMLKAGETLDLTAAKTQDERGADCYRLTLSFDGKTEEYTFYHDSKIGSVFVQTSIGLSAIDRNKSTRDKQSEILILDNEGKTEYSDGAAQTKSEIKSRGNATWTYLKKAYQIKLDSKTDLFDMGKAKTWILLANYTDQSALHNALGFSLGDAVGVPYNTQYRFVNFYVDGEYRGMYMLCEKAQIGDNRVEIEDLEKATEKANPDRELDSFPIRSVTSGKLIQETILTKYTYCDGMKSPEDITGGYIVELDGYGLNEPCHFVTENGNIYTVKSPEYASREEMEYIATLFADMEEAIYSDTGYNRKGIHYSEYIDVPSFAGVYTVQELMKNWDAYIGSMFFFKDADKNGETSKIYMGPLWDLDNTLGNIEYDKYFFDDTSFLWAQHGVFQNYVRGFAKNLMEHPEFHNAVAEKFAIAYSAANYALAEGGWIEKMAETIGESVVMDRTRWKSYDSNSWLLTQTGSKSSVKFVHFKEYGTPQDDTKDTALGFLRYYLSARSEALLDSIGKEVPVPPPLTPPEQTTVSSEQTTSQSEQETTESASSDSDQNTSASVGELTESTADTSQTTDETSGKPAAKPIFSIRNIMLAVCALAAIFVGLLFFVVMKKRR
ncbi:MAG: CotH kinase family protein [Clostridia bacterium]|nr:CotH kinase family protein [Clostridia bacterium]